MIVPRFDGLLDGEQRLSRDLTGGGARKVSKRSHGGRGARARARIQSPLSPGKEARGIESVSLKRKQPEKYETLDALDLDAPRKTRGIRRSHARYCNDDVEAFVTSIQPLPVALEP
jgi:hypothetical protein